MRIFFDCEFEEDGRTIELISIGAVREDGVTYYAESVEYDRYDAPRWLRYNVFPFLGPYESCLPKGIIAQQMREFVGDKPEFWGYYADYDWVCLCQLYGKMIDLPKGWPMYCRDIKQLCDDLGNPQLPGHDGVKHHALQDALWNKRAWEFLQAQLDG